jgi:hypothetical protein
MTAPKPPERITMYKHATGALHAECPHRTDPHVYIHEAAVEKRERAYIRLKDWAIANFHEGYDAQLDEILAALAAAGGEK